MSIKNPLKNFAKLTYFTYLISIALYVFQRPALSIQENHVDFVRKDTLQPKDHRPTLCRGSHLLSKNQSVTEIPSSSPASSWQTKGENHTSTHLFLYQKQVGRTKVEQRWRSWILSQRSQKRRENENLSASGNHWSKSRQNHPIKRRVKHHVTRQK